MGGSPGCPGCATALPNRGKSVIFVIVKGYDMDIIFTITAGVAVAVIAYKAALFLGNLILSEEESK